MSAVPVPNPVVAVTLRVNGQEHALRIEPRETLLDVLRERLDLTGAKPACERGECGACAVLLDGQPIHACHWLAVQAVGHAIVTIEGLSREPGFQPLKNALIGSDAGQCGYCTPGFAVAAHALLRDEPGATEQAIRWGLVGHTCRCNAYESIVAAVRQAAAKPRRS
jgi:aerobic-type carbon monoxide dehydrogenase small subunit (CoxS/CutS family)